MIRTSLVIFNLDNIPREWVFEHYLQLPEKLTGQEVRIRSLWNPDLGAPSMYIYYGKGSSKYQFKDFSSGKGGDGLELVMQMSRIGLVPGCKILETRAEASRKVVEDYRQFLSRNPTDEIREYVEHFKYKVHSWELRDWNTIDRDFWTAYRIGSAQLDQYCVKPLKSFVMRKQLSDGGFKDIEMSRSKIYGYFRLDGSLHKIYQPGNGEHKFIKVQSYVQGSEQLTYSKPVLIITKALKDIMSLTRMPLLNSEFVAPDSENAILQPYVLQSYLNKYESVFTMFDNDEAGIKAMKRYEQDYKIPSLHLKAEKDPSDTVKAHGLERTQEWILKLIKEKTHETVGRY